MNRQIYKLVLSMVIMMIIFAIFLIPALDKNSAEYVITVFSTYINILFLVFIIAKLIFEKYRVKQ